MSNKIKVVGVMDMDGAETRAARYEQLKKFYDAPEYREHVATRTFKDGGLGFVTVQSGLVKEINEKDMTVTHFISTPRIDYVKDVMDPFGADCTPLEKNRAVFYNHSIDGAKDLPIGKMQWLSRTKEGVLAKTVYAGNETQAARDVFNLAAGGFLNSWSIGFMPKQFDFVTLSALIPTIEGKFDIANAGDFAPDTSLCYHKSWMCYEYSQVGVPMNQDALTSSNLRKAIAGGMVKSEILKGYLIESLGGRERLEVNTEGRIEKSVDEKAAADTLVIKELAKLHSAGIVADRPSWNRTRSKAFDVAAEPLSPTILEYEWVSKFLGVGMKDVYKTQVELTHAEMGSMLTALKCLGAQMKCDGTRNIISNGTEAPPLYETIQLNAKLSENFLVEGISFYSPAHSKMVTKQFAKGAAGDLRIVVKRSPTWWGIILTIYTTLERASDNVNFVNEIYAESEKHNFLKGEAFSLGGEFLERSGTEWADIFLEAKNASCLTKLVDAVNAKGKALPNRGLIMMGPPGTGKTLSGRAIMGSAKSTFIWISARDFYYAGSFRGFAKAFEMAKKNAPTILFFEDIDNWIGGSEIDLLKTTMDGISKSTGTVTIMTTNHPDALPDALIDRPGRFHDVLLLNLPDESTRELMIRKWLPDAGDGAVAKAVKETAGYSGAHMFELAYFANSLASTEGKEIDDALQLALTKITEQRELIDSVQSRGSYYKPHKSVMDALERKGIGELSAAEEFRVLEFDEKGVIPFKEYSKADEGEAWDGPAERSAASVEDLKKMCTWYDDSKPDAKGSYKLPHHKADGYAVVWNGVKAAMGALLGARGGASIPAADKRGCYNHLKKHYAQFEKEPPEFKSYTEMELKAMFPDDDNEIEPEPEPITKATDPETTQLLQGISDQLQTVTVLLEQLLEQEDAEPQDPAPTQSNFRKPDSRQAAKTAGDEAATADAQASIDRIVARVVNSLKGKV